MSDKSQISTKPYLIRALYEWCVDSGHTPYLAVTVNSRTRVPMEFVKNGEIVLNIAASAVHNLAMGNDFIDFAARFNGVSRDISIPLDAVSGIYARETGQGMAFELEPLAGEPEPQTAAESKDRESAPEGDDNPPKPPAGGRPRLQIVK
jgi:stringent starvation protein B